MNPIAAALLFGGESGGSSDPIVASSVTYDGTSSGLSSENVQDAIDEVNEKIEEQPNPMVYKGTLGTGGTITSLPTASLANEGYVYKVKTEDDYILDTIYYRVAFLVSTGNVSADKSMDPDFSNIVDSVSVAAPRYNGVAFVFDDNKLEVGTKDATGSFGGNIYVKSLIDGVHYNNNIYNAGEIMASGNKASNRNWGPITYGPSIHAKVGDMFISNGAEWTHIPSGDDMVIADEVTYDNTSSALTSENVQDAIDEIKTSLDSVETEAEAAQIPTLTKSQYDALTEAQKTDGTLREVKDYTFDGEIKVVYSKAFGSREYYGKVTDEYYVTDEEKYKTGIKAHVVMDYYSIQTGHHTQKEYFDAQGISSTSNGLIAISNYDPNYNDGRIALFPEPYAGKNQFYPYGYNIQNKNLVVCWNNSTGTGVGETGTPDGGDGSNQRNGYTSFSYNVPIFLTQAEATTYVTTGEGLNKAVNYKNSKKSTVLIRNKEVVGITDSNALPFDGTGSDLSSTNAADAIKEVNSKIPSDIQAEDVGYDNTTSGLTATDVNSAIDEVNDKIDNIEVAAEDVSYEKSEGVLIPEDIQGVVDTFLDGYTNTLEEHTDTYKFTTIQNGYSIVRVKDGVIYPATTLSYYDPALRTSKDYYDLHIYHDGDHSGNPYVITPGANMKPGFIGSGSFSGEFTQISLSGSSVQSLADGTAITLDETIPPEFHSGASYVNYDNTDSGLEATDVQGAIDEVSEKLKVEDISDSVTLSTSATQVEFQDVKISKIGNIVVMDIPIKTLSNISSGSNIDVTFTGMTALFGMVIGYFETYGLYGQLLTNNSFRIRVSPSVYPDVILLVHALFVV